MKVECRETGASCRRSPGPCLLIIGTMKCATTSLFGYLAEHPAIAPSAIKSRSTSRAAKGRAALARYEDLWSFDPDRHRYAMEASTATPSSRARGGGGDPRLRPPAAADLPRARPVRADRVALQLHAAGPAWQRAIPTRVLVQTSNYWLYVEDYSRVFGPGEPAWMLDYMALRGDPRGTVNRACALPRLPSASS